MLEIDFVHFRPGHCSRQQQELESARIKSHAARASQRRMPRPRRNPVFGLCLDPGALVPFAASGNFGRMPEPSEPRFECTHHLHHAPEARQPCEFCVSLSRQSLMRHIHHPPVFDGVDHYVSTKGLEYCLSFHTPGTPGLWMVEHMVAFAAACHVILAIAIGLRQSENHSLQPFKEPRIQFHRLRAISLLRQRLSLLDTLTDDGVVFTMLLLGQLDQQMGDFDTARTHQHYSHAFISARGGVNALRVSSGMKDFAQQYAHFGTVSTRPPFSSTSHIPEGFRKLAFAIEFLPETLSMIARLTRAQDETFVRDQSEKISTYRRAEWWSNPFSKLKEQGGTQQQAITAACPGLTVADDESADPPLERSLCVAMICHFLNENNSELVAADTHSHWTARLWDDLERTIGTDNAITREALIWMWLTYVNSVALSATNLETDVVPLLHRLQDRFEMQEWAAVDVEQLAARFTPSARLSVDLQRHWRKRGGGQP